MYLQLTECLRPLLTKENYNHVYGILHCLDDRYYRPIASNINSIEYEKIMGSIGTIEYRFYDDIII